MPKQRRESLVAYRFVDWAQWATGLAGTAIGVVGGLIGVRWSNYASAKNRERTEAHERDKVARRTLVERMRLVSEWATTVEDSFDAIFAGFSDGRSVILRGSRAVLRQSDARDVMRGLARAHPEAGRLFDDFDQRAHEFLELALLIKRMMELAPGTRALDHRGEFGQLRRLYPTISESRRRLKQKLMAMAESLGEDLLIARNGRWDDFVRNNDVVLSQDEPSRLTESAT